MTRFTAVGGIGVILALILGGPADAQQINWPIDVQWVTTNSVIKGAMGPARANKIGTYIGCYLDVSPGSSPNVFCDAQIVGIGGGALSCTSQDRGIVKVVQSITPDSLIWFATDSVDPRLCGYLRVSTYSAFPPKQP